MTDDPQSLGHRDAEGDVPRPGAPARGEAPGARASFGGAGKYAGLGLQFAGAILLFVYVGQWLDRRFGTDPVFLYLGAFMGAGAAFYSMYRSLMADQRREEEARARGKERDR